MIPVAQYRISMLQSKPKEIEIRKLAIRVIEIEINSGVSGGQMGQINVKGLS